MTKVGIIGAGEISRNVHLPVLGSMSRVMVAWIFDRDAERASALARAFRIPAIMARDPADLPGADLVLLAIPVESRRSYLTDLARRGIAAFCEKPFATSVQEHSELVSMFPVERLGCGYMRRFYQSIRTMRWILEHGWFGKIREVRYTEGGRSRGSSVEGSFLDDPALGRSRGVLMDLGSHGLDTVLYLLRPYSVSVRNCNLILDGHVDRKASGVLDFRLAQSQTDVCVEFCVSWLDHQANRLELQFEHATVWCGVGPESNVYVGVPGAMPRSALLAAPVSGARNSNQAFFLEWEAFLEGIARTEESPVSAASALRTTELVNAIHAHNAS
jgi:predicted dehydrogenase